MREIVIPEKLAPLVKAFSADDQSARLLIMEAAKVINSAQEIHCYRCDTKAISNEELEGIISLMKNIAPRDTIEMIYGAQIVSSHLIGLLLLRHNFEEDQILGLKFLSFSNEAMMQLQEKRAGGINQNISIVYNHAASGLA